ncbi:NAD(P)/FAD-dependent oxidoreductase [Sphingomonas hankyongi]|uniref:FAD-binding oxidoreductase n=1 Tax=Sphingomonas hankyongi TaxID=2908209 RepID=A0ABT0S237_9SPHN|nr:FAD-binding oxidoreductase [Sphingomonas hankyongi]MCL6729929.1 FAD-binding oxidoreductase [Sphingomonas hankyongi]
MKDPIAIVGAGIAGAYLAYRLARDGHAVLVVDDARPGRATGWNPGGINPLHGPGFPGAMEGFYRDAFRLHAEHHEYVQARSGTDFGWRVVDRLFLAKDEQEAVQLRSLADKYNELEGFSAQWMDPAEIGRWDARVGESWVGGLMTRGNVRVDAERYRQALLAVAGSMGAEIISGTLKAVATRDRAIESIDWGHGAVAIRHLCMATGSRSDDPIAGWSPGKIVPVTPAIGDLLLVRSSDAPPLADVSNGLTAIYQHDGDHFWIGGTVRADGPLGETSETIERALLAGAHSLMPGWKAPEVVARSSAARPATADGLPAVGQTPNYANGWIINGLGGKGILLSAWTAEIVARMIGAEAALNEFATVSPDRPADHG